MRLSNIIKVHQSSEAVPFTFKEVGGLAGTEHPHQPSPSTESDEESEATAVDPLEELEQMIQGRMKEAERRALELESEGYEKGYEQGLKDGTETGRKGMQITQENLDKLLQALQSLPGRILQDYREWFLDSVLAVARQVVQKELETRPEILKQLIHSLLEELEECHSVVITINPRDLGLLEEHTGLKELLRKSVQSLSIKPDPQMGRGGCRIETELQVLDGSIETRFSLVEQALKRTETVDEDGASQ